MMGVYTEDMLSKFVLLYDGSLNRVLAIQILLQACHTSLEWRLLVSHSFAENIYPYRAADREWMITAQDKLNGS